MGRGAGLLRFAVEACSEILPRFELSPEVSRLDEKLLFESAPAVDQLSTQWLCIEFRSWRKLSDDECVDGLGGFLSLFALLSHT
jgi:hypothetical protein